ncbi:MAG: RNA methyltransferase [Candidatus Hydrogenedentes bacterium]|nr:RNA methyltransferase [Candidatus Hydrogenedentota bacterium]
MTTVFPHKEPIKVGDLLLSSEEIISGLCNWITEERKQRIESVINNRTYTVVTVLDGLYDIGNVNAVIRTSESLGFQCVHIVETCAKYKTANRITQGAEKWLDILRWKSAEECLNWLRERGYRICATAFENAKPIDQVNFLIPTAIVLGNEHSGVSSIMTTHADERVIIPMYGFTKSFNISVAGGIILYHAVMHRISHLGKNGDLTPDERKILKALFYLKSVGSPEKILHREITKTH